MSGVSGIIDGISNPNNFRDRGLHPGMGAAAAAALCLKPEHWLVKDSVTLDLLRNHLTCLGAQLENELNTFKPNRNHLKFLPSTPHLPSRRKRTISIRINIY